MINVKNIQRPTLFQDFFGLLLTYSNEIIEFINTTEKKSVTPNRSNATYLKHSIRFVKKLVHTLSNPNIFQFIQFIKSTLHE
jgi:hypothetical protein